MTTAPNEFEERILSKLRVIVHELSQKDLSIAVLGPDLDNLKSEGTRKRYEIRDALQDQGHAPFFPEERIGPSDETLPWVGQENQLLSDDSVDLVIMLDTDDSGGVLVELGNFVASPAICSKTAILFPARHYNPGQSLGLPADTLRAYWTTMFYSDLQMSSCALVPICKRWADDRRNGTWRFLPSQTF